MTDDQTLVAGWQQEEVTWHEQFQGWNFSQLTSTGRMSFNMSEEQLGWDYMKIICEAVARLSDRDEIYLLDLGTGGGEYLQSILSEIRRREGKLHVYATESYEPNFSLAKQRLSPFGVCVIQTSPDSLDSLLPFADNAPKFDLILSRHTCYNIREVNRLLKPRTGVFITQQVDGKSAHDLIELFGHQPQWPFFNLAFALRTIETQAPGLQLIRAEEAQTTLAFKDIGALVIYLHAVPWMVPDFTVPKYQAVLLQLHRQGEKAWTFQSKYMLLQAVKNIQE